MSVVLPSIRPALPVRAVEGGAADERDQNGTNGRGRRVARPVAITDATFKAEVYESDKPVLVNFWAAWSDPARDLAPVLQEVATEMERQIKVARVDVDSNPTSTASFGVRGIPTLILFKNGRPATRLVGFRTKNELVERLAPHLI